MFLHFVIKRPRPPPPLHTHTHTNIYVFQFEGLLHETAQVLAYSKPELPVH